MPIPSSIQTFIDGLAADSPVSFSDLRAVIFNNTLKRSPEPSHTDGLLDVVRGTLTGVGAQVDTVRGLGCDRGQGFFFSRPLPMEQLTHLFGRKRMAA